MDRPLRAMWSAFFQRAEQMWVPKECFLIDATMASYSGRWCKHFAVVAGVRRTSELAPWKPCRLLQLEKTNIEISNSFCSMSELAWIAIKLWFPELRLAVKKGGRRGVVTGQRHGAQWVKVTVKQLMYCSKLVLIYMICSRKECHCPFM